MQSYEEFQAEVNKAVATLQVYASGKPASFGDGYKERGIDISLPACECAAVITGYDLTFCKMLNHEFRTAAATFALERATA